MARPAPWFTRILGTLTTRAAEAKLRAIRWDDAYALRRTHGKTPIDIISKRSVADELTKQIAQRLADIGVPTRTKSGAWRELSILPSAMLDDRREVVRWLSSLSQELPERSRYWRMVTATSGQRCQPHEIGDRISALKAGAGKWAANARVTYQVDLLMVRIELARAPDGTWHVHAHLVIDRYFVGIPGESREDRIQRTDQQWQAALAALQRAIGGHVVHDDERLGFPGSSQQAEVSPTLAAARVASYLLHSNDLLACGDNELREVLAQTERTRCLELYGQLRVWRRLCIKKGVRWLAVGEDLAPVLIASFPGPVEHDQECGIFARHEYTLDQSTKRWSAGYYLVGHYADRVRNQGPWTDRQRNLLAAADQWRERAQRRIDDGSFFRYLAGLRERISKARRVA